VRFNIHNGSMGTQDQVNDSTWSLLTHFHEQIKVLMVSQSDQPELLAG
jgi:hypothetical protein